MPASAAPFKALTASRASRRRLLVSSVCLLGSLIVSTRTRAQSPANPLPPTPVQTAGPFYPHSKPIDSDADLLTVAGRGTVARGTPTLIAGRVLDPAGSVIAGALVEIWQCDAFGRYHHPLDGGGADPAFQGYGRCETAADGGYRFRTIRPVAYGSRTPHIHFLIRAPGFPPLTTQMYVAGEPGNATDFVLGSIRDPAARARVIVPLAAAQPGAAAELAGHFDIVLAG